MCSCILKGLELASGCIVDHLPVAFTVLSDQFSAHKLTHQVLGHLLLLVHLFHHLDLLLQCIVVGQFGCNLLLLHKGCLLLIFDLLLSSSPFASLLEQVCRYSFASCRRSK